eukprot:978557-Prymnesium_polylepis.1
MPRAPPSLPQVPSPSARPLLRTTARGPTCDCAASRARLPDGPQPWGAAARGSHCRAPCPSVPASSPA